MSSLTGHDMPRDITNRLEALGGREYYGSFRLDLVTLRVASCIHVNLTFDKHAHTHTQDWLGACISFQLVSVCTARGERPMTVQARSTAANEDATEKASLRFDTHISSQTLSMCA